MHQCLMALCFHLTHQCNDAGMFGVSEHFSQFRHSFLPHHQNTPIILCRVKQVNCKENLASELHMRYNKS